MTAARLAGPQPEVPVYDVLLAIVGVGAAATLLGLALAIATVFAAEPRRHRKLVAG